MALVWVNVTLSLICLGLLVVVVNDPGRRRPPFQPPGGPQPAPNRCVAQDHIVLSWPTPDPQSRVEQAFKAGPIGGGQ